MSKTTDTKTSEKNMIKDMIKSFKKISKKNLIAIAVFAITASIFTGTFLYISKINAENESLQAQNYAYSISTFEDRFSAVSSDLKNELEETQKMSAMMSQLEEKVLEIEEENQRLYELIESNDTNKNIEHYFEKVAYLTFDDGPSYMTLKVLNILDNYNIKATFFVLHTDYGVKHDVYNEIVDRGHAIGNHTYNHVYPHENWENFWDDFFLMEDFLYDEVGIRPRIVRLPGGSSNRWNYDEEAISNLEKLHSMGYQYFDWNVSVGDSNPEMHPEEVIFDTVPAQSRGGSVEKLVILMHDKGGNTTTVDALPHIIQYLRDCGYTFLPLNEDSFAPSIYGID